MANIAEIEQAYFDRSRPNVNSFAEYWEEISYGDVQVSGTVTGWVTLPWPVLPINGTPDAAGQYSYGQPEGFSNKAAAIVIDPDGDPYNQDDGAPPTPGLEDCAVKACNQMGKPVWTPGERFVDLDGDGRWDCLDESAGIMDCLTAEVSEVGSTIVSFERDGLPDAAMAWTDWNGDLAATNEEGCVLPDVAFCEPPIEGTDCGPGEGQTRCCCEFDDINRNGKMDITEPFEDFMRRWDPCATCPDALTASTHWIKTWDPASPHAGDPLGCSESASPFPPRMYEMGQIQPSYASPIYILNNYPAIDPGQPDPDGIGPETGSGILGRTNNGYYDPPDAWGESFNTKMFWTGGPGRATITPEPGWVLPDRSGPLDKPWYSDAWRDRYGSAPPFWPTIPNPSGPIGGPPAGYPMANSPEIVPFDNTQRIYFQANRGGLDGAGSGWEADPFVHWETGLMPATLRVLPEEINGPTAAKVFYDGWVEHDDLPSSKYHWAGDQRLGEVTSPYSESISGVDTGDHNPNTNDLRPDFVTVAAGPYAVNIFGDQGRDAGNNLMMEWLTWRTNGRNLSYAIKWEQMWGGHPFAGPGSFMNPNANLGFRDFNLDGIIDQGQVRPAGSENYVADQYAATPNTGTLAVYPFNRRRLVEDVIEAIDDSFDFDSYIDRNTMQQVNGGPDRVRNGAQDAGAGYLPWFPGGTSPPLVQAEGFLSGIVLLAPGSHRGGLNADFPTYPGYTFIHNEDNDHDTGKYPLDTKQYNWNLWFHDLVMAIGAQPRYTDNPLDRFQTAYAAHEYGHTWQGWPDLYDYDRYAPLFGQSGQVENYPIGDWGLMASGGLVHPMPILKADQHSEWITPIDLRTVLTPGVPKTITMPPSELTRTSSHYVFPRTEGKSGTTGESFWFWSVGRGFDQTLPGDGLLVMHIDRQANNESLPPQQMLEHHFTYDLVEADGLDQMNAGENAGDAGDAFPGTSFQTAWNNDTDPNSEWWGGDNSGIEFGELTSLINGGSMATFLWNPTELPTLRFINPPGGASVTRQNGREIYQLRFEVSDLCGGTEIEFYWLKQPTNYNPLSFPVTNLIGTITPGAADRDSIDWDITDLDPSASYRVFARLIPRGTVTGEDCPPGGENTFLGPFPRQSNRGTAEFHSSTVTVHRPKAKLESWTLVNCGTIDEFCEPGPPAAPRASGWWPVRSPVHR